MLQNLSDESNKRYDKIIHISNTREKQPNNSSNSSTNIQKLSKELQHTLHICNKISKIPFFNIYFQLIYNNKELSFVSNTNTQPKTNIKTKTKKDIPLEYMKKIETDNTDNSEKYVLINTDMKFANSLFLYSYDEYFSLLCSRSKKELCAKIFNTCLFILDALHILQRHGLFLLHFSKTNLSFNQIEIPFIQNFKYCIEKSDAMDKLVCNDNIITNVNAPLELWVIYYLKKNPHIQSLSNHHIETICKNFIDNHQIFKTIVLTRRETEKTKYYDKSINYLQPLINMPLQNSIEFMLKYMDTWDNYGFHMFFLNEMVLQFELGSGSNTFWDGFIQIFMQNILSNPHKRNNIQQTKVLVQEYLNKNTKHLRI